MLLRDLASLSAKRCCQRFRIQHRTESWTVLVPRMPVVSPISTHAHLLHRPWLLLWTPSEERQRQQSKG